MFPFFHFQISTLAQTSPELILKAIIDWMLKLLTDSFWIFLTFAYLKDTKEVQPFDRIGNWAIKIFPKSNELKASELNDQDNISYDASESRIINIGLTIAMAISLVVFGQIMQIYVVTKNQQIIVERKLPDITNAFGKYLLLSHEY